MTDQIRTLELDFELETEDEHTDLERSAAAVRAALSAIPGVDEAAAEVSDPARMIDPMSLAAILLTVRYVVKDSADIVQSLDDLVENLKKLGRDLGLPHLKVWLGMEKVDAHDLTAGKLRELAAETEDTEVPPRQPGG